MVHQKPGREAGVSGQNHAQYHRQEHPHGIRPHRFQIQAKGIVSAHGPRVKQNQQRREAQKIIAVVPPLIGDDPQRRDDPEFSDGGLIPHGKRQSGKNALVKLRLKRGIQPVEQIPRQIG
ncbi:hypothetical protein SDC9_124559 [bioreactor metagenome]|uniref:Uncharacterized protein n=1 Tax=bioreactor metagenome TaxID=1076179 RepID=A0A645CKU7_9ZZZZ